MILKDSVKYLPGLLIGTRLVSVVELALIALLVETTSIKCSLNFVMPFKSLCYVLKNIHLIVRATEKSPCVCEFLRQRRHSRHCATFIYLSAPRTERRASPTLRLIREAKIIYMWLGKMVS